MNTKEVADRLVGLCRTGQFEQAINELYSDNIVSVEPKGAPMELAEGIEAVRGKTQHFQNSVEEFHNNEVSDPLVAGNHFSCRMDMDVTMKGMGRINMEEVCVYEVKDGKIVKEQFFFQAEPPAA